METNNEFNKSDRMIGEQLTIKHFWFLVDEYRFKYQRYTFRSKKILIEVQVGHKTPRVVFNKIGEPDPQLFYLDLEWVIAFFYGEFPSANYDYLKHDLERNMIFASNILRDNSDRLINEFDNWWMPAHVFLYRWMERKARDDGQLERFHRTHKHYYDYLKSKGAI